MPPLIQINDGEVWAFLVTVDPMAVNRHEIFLARFKDGYFERVIEGETVLLINGNIASMMYAMKMAWPLKWGMEF